MNLAMKEYMNSIESLPVIIIHNIPLPGHDPQVISVHKEASISTVDYSVNKTSGYLILALDCNIKKDHNSQIKIENIVNNQDLKIAGVLCKIINNVFDKKDGKDYLKILLTTHSRVIISEIKTVCYTNQEIILAHIAKNSFDNIEYISKRFGIEFNLVSAFINNTETNKEHIQTLVKELMSRFEYYCQLYGLAHIFNPINNIENISHKLDKLVFEFKITSYELFQLITEFNLMERIVLVKNIIEKEILKNKLYRQIDETTKENLEKTQKIYLLREKLTVINKELENLSGEINEADALEAQLIKLKLEEKIEKKLLSEIRRLKISNNNSSDFSVIKNYLDYCLNMPWNTFSETKRNFKDVHSDLDKEHYGMNKVKERILEYLAVEFKNGKAPKSAILFIGPPGVGKTSLSKKIATALGRQFVRISLGGIRDEAEIRGHRRTYLGSMPGKIIKAIKEAKTMNPVILLDEIDKISRHDSRGDPADALLEVLDREQSTDFVDHYLDIPFDLSRVMFICTANSLSPISQPILDRVEIIELASYSDNEKFKIAKDYMIPKQIREHNLSENQIIFTDQVIKSIINLYTREAGVRGLGEQISIIIRKILLKIICEGITTPFLINNENLESFLGLPEYLREGHKQDMIGIIHGLAWNQLGGDILTIEAVSIPNETPSYHGSIKCTGKLGEVMQESVQTAFSYLKSCRNQIGIKESNYRAHDIHLHVPEGSIPKDGPSAGITIFTGLVSLLLQKKIRSDIAMTGEITLRGRVLPIGGLKEKILAAKRNGINTILIPKSNMKELQEIPQDLKDGIEIILIQNAVDALQYALIDYKDPKPIIKKSKKSKDESSSDLIRINKELEDLTV